MNISPKVSLAKALVDGTIKAVQQNQTDFPGVGYKLGIRLVLSPGAVTDSEALSFLQQLSSALTKFSPDLAAQLELEIPANSPAQDNLENVVEAFVKPIAELEQSLAAAKKQLVIPQLAQASK